MIADDFIDGFMGLLPGLRGVTVKNADGTTMGTPDARREDASEEIKAMAGVSADTETVVWFFPVAFTGFVRPRNRWTITDTGGDGSIWVVIKDDMTIQSRGVAIMATRQH